MTTEETELTFIRCPSCRSLVPAVATRCRMCGHHFDAEAEDSPDSLDPLKKKSRVRQRTISVSKDEVEEVTHQEGEEQEASEQLSGLGADESPEDRMLLPEDMAEAGQPGLAEELPVSEPEDDHGEVPFVSGDFDETIMTGQDKSEQEAAEVVPEPEEVVQPLEEPLPPLEEPLPSLEEPVPPLEEPVQPLEEPDGIVEQSSAEPDFKEPEVSAESPDEGQPLGETGEKSDSDRVETEPPREKRKKRRRRRKRRAAVDVSAQTESDTEEDQQIANSEPERESIMASSESAIEDDGLGHVDQPISRAKPLSEGPQISQEQDGVLVGWFVNFDQDPKGLSGEVRAGRFFIGKQRLRGNDMVISDSAISTPHCLVAASASDGLQIQDLMSEQGTFIKRRGSDSFVRVHDVANVEHGDRLRFGSYEVLVCLVPG